MRFDGCVRRGIEISVVAILGCVDDDRVGTVALDMGVAARVEVVALSEFGAKSASIHERRSGDEFG